jgi:hypothetical protein
VIVLVAVLVLGSARSLAHRAGFGYGEGYGAADEDGALGKSER